MGKNFIQVKKSSQTLSDEPPSYCTNPSRQTKFLVFPNLYKFTVELEHSIYRTSEGTEQIPTTETDRPKNLPRAVNAAAPPNKSPMMMMAMQMASPPPPLLLLLPRLPMAPKFHAYLRNSIQLIQFSHRVLLKGTTWASEMSCCLIQLFGTTGEDCSQDFNFHCSECGIASCVLATHSLGDLIASFPCGKYMIY